MSTTKTVPIEALRPNSWNTNFASPANEAKLDASIRRFGVFKPIIVREVPGTDGYEIVGGEHRWESARRIGITEVPVSNMGPIDDAEAKEVMIVDNARYGADDSMALAELLQGMGDPGELQEFLPYSETDLNALFSPSNIALEDFDLDDLPQEAEEPVEIKTAKAPKTHTMMRFKVANEDAEHIAELIETTKKAQGFTAEDQATNAGDALVYLLFRLEK